MSPRPITPVRPIRPVEPVPTSEWKEVKKLTKDNLEFGAYWAGGANADRAVDDHIAKLAVSLLHITISRRIDNFTKLYYYYVGQEGAQIARIYIYFRPDRTGTRTYRVKVGYLPKFGWEGNEGGGTLEIKTTVTEAGDTINYPARSLGSVTYPTMDGVEGRDDAELISESFQITEHFREEIEDHSAQIDIFARPTGYHIGGIIEYITLEKLVKLSEIVRPR
jgi:hypothetical protein